MMGNVTRDLDRFVQDMRAKLEREGPRLAAIVAKLTREVDAVIASHKRPAE